jgi:hypothetical protein
MGRWMSIGIRARWRLMTSETGPTNKQKLQVFHNSWNDTELSVSLTTPIFPTEQYRRYFSSQALARWSHVGSTWHA